MASEPWLRVAYAAPLANARWRELLGRYGSAEALAGLSRAELEAAGVNPRDAAKFHEPDSATLERWQTWLSENGRRLIGIDDPDYPELLRTIPDAPLALWVSGRDSRVLSDPQLAIVGSRNPTHNGRDTAETFARYLSERGLTITSGLAAGIDGAAHAGAIAGGTGTIAVLGCGLDRVYPSTHAELAERTGLTLAELSSMLLILEFEGLVEALPGGRYARLAERES